MSFGFSIGDLIVVANLANKVRKRFVDSPDQFRAVSDEVKSLSNVLRDLEDVFPERSLTDNQTADLKDNLQGCDNVLADLDKVLDNYHDLGNASGHAGLAKKSRRFWKRLTFEPDDVKELRSRLGANIGLLNVFMGSLALGLSYATKAGVDLFITYQGDQNYLAIMDWLSNTDFPAQQADLFRSCQEGTGQWLLDSKEFQSWLDGAEPTLFCPGIPGAGKTLLTSIVVNHLHERFGQDPDVGVAYLYCNYKRQAEQTIEDLIASLLKELIQGRPVLHTEVESLYQDHSRKGTRPSLEELSTALDMIANKHSRVFIIIDALDECTDLRVRSGLLKEVTTVRAREISVFATSRFIPEILSEFDGKSSIEIRATDGDVRRYLETHMTVLPICVRRNQLLQETIITEVTRAVDGMFLLAQLHLGSLSGKTTAKAVKIALQKLPKGSKALDSAYREALERIEAQKSDLQQLAKQVLSWIVCAARQLSVLELQHALAVEDGASELDEENLPEPDEMISVCAGLVTVDEDSNIIRLVHYTTQEYFERTLSVWAPHAGIEITKTCLAYLSFDAFVESPWDDDYHVSKIRGGYQELFKDHLLLRYAAEHWHFHAENCWSESVEQMVLFFLEKEREIAIYYQMVQHIDRHRFPYMRDISKQLKAMHFAAYFGLEKIALALLKADHDPQAKDSQGRTPLTYAAQKGRQAITKLLLSMNEIDVNVKDIFGATLLHHAARKGRENIIGILLDQKTINADAKDGRGGTPLFIACFYGHEGVVKLLIERNDVDVNSLTLNSETPLSIACLHGHEGVVKLLLKREGILINLRNSRGSTPLALAAWRGRAGIVTLLLERDDVATNAEDLSISLIMAASGGQKAVHVVGQLMKRKDIQINYQDADGRTALMSAAERGCEGTVRLLLERDDIRVNSRDQEGRTALMLAAEKGYGSAVKLLLERSDVQINCRDQKCRTALMLAFDSGHEAVVNLLLEAGAQGEIPGIGVRGDYRGNGLSESGVGRFSERDMAREEELSSEDESASKEE